MQSSKSVLNIYMILWNFYINKRCALKFYDLQIFTDVMKCGRRSYIPSNKYVILLQELFLFELRKSWTAYSTTLAYQSKIDFLGQIAISQQLQHLTKE